MGTAITEAKDQFSFNPFMARLKTRFSVGLTPEKSGQMGDSENPGPAPYHDCRSVSRPVSFIK